MLCKVLFGNNISVQVEVDYAYCIVLMLLMVAIMIPITLAMVKSVKILGKYSGDCCDIFINREIIAGKQST